MCWYLYGSLRILNLGYTLVFEVSMSTRRSSSKRPRLSTSDRLDTVEKGLEVVSTTIARIERETHANFSYLEALISSLFDKVAALSSHHHHTPSSPSHSDDFSDSWYFENTIYTNWRIKKMENVMTFKREWKISDLSKLQHVWTSDEFTIGHHRWIIRFYPKGDEDGGRGYIAICLVLVNPEIGVPHQPVKVEGRFCIKDVVPPTCHSYSDKFCTWFVEPYESCGYDEFLEIEEMLDPLAGFVVDDCCFLQTEISVLAVAEHDACLS